MKFALLLLLVWCLLRRCGAFLAPQATKVGQRKTRNGSAFTPLSAATVAGSVTVALDPSDRNSDSGGANTLPPSSLVPETPQKARPSWLRRRLTSLGSAATIIITGIIFRFIMQVMNSTTVVQGYATLRDAVLRRPQGRALMTYSNHASVYDDPGLWSAVLPFWRTRKMRWALCTDDVYYASKYLTPLLALGKTLPLSRKKGLNQASMAEFSRKLDSGEWVHIFPEGRIRQPWRFQPNEPLLADFKVGIGKLLMRCKEPPIVLPIYHIGCHNIAPEEPGALLTAAKLVSAVPRGGNRVRVYVGEPLDLGPLVQKWQEGTGGRTALGDTSGEPWEADSAAGWDAELRAYKEIAQLLRDEVAKLERKARADFFGPK